jgi:predicted DNA-binding transcriptional regulator YafY
MRGSTEQLVDRIYAIVREVVRRPGRLSRAELAQEYQLTPRTISTTIASARRLFGVVIQHEGDGYVVKEPGVLDVRWQGKYLQVRR